MITGVHAVLPQAGPAWVMPACAAVAGAIVGSFVGAALERMPAGRSVVTGRSRCDGCGKTLRPVELVPVLSWLVQRGRCRACDAPIGGWQLACELGGAAIAVVAWGWAGERQALAAMLLGWQLMLLALLDLRHMWLPRVLTIVLALTGLGVACARWWSGEGAAALAVAVGGGALGYGLLALVAAGYRRVRGREGIGGGDAPLLGAIGLWVGPVGVVEVLLGASIAGLAAAAAMAAGGRRLAADTALPLGTCLAVAAWAVFMLNGWQ